MSLAIESKHDGIIRFYHEKCRAGRNMIAVFPPAKRGDQWRNALAPDGYTEVPVEYVRSLRPAREDVGYDRAEAERMIERIDARSEYVRDLMGTPAAE